MKLLRLIPSSRLAAGLFCIGLFVGALAEGQAQVVSPPTILEVRLLSVGPESASFSVKVARNGAPTSVAIEYGTTTNYGTATTVFDDPAATDGEFTGFVSINGLTQGTLYHYRGAASNSAGVVTGEDHTFRAGNQPPFAGHDHYVRRNGSGPFELFVLYNDVDSEQDPLQILAVSQGAHGSVAINPGAESVSYTLTELGFAGSDTFTYTIGDGTGATATGVVTIHLGRLPVATEILFAAGDPVPSAGVEGSDIPEGATFATFGIPSINRVGKVGFSARILSEGELRPVIVGPNPDGTPGVQVRGGDPATNREGEPLPLTFTSFHHPMLNERGDVAFVARVTGAGVNAGNDFGIWLKESDGIRLVAREGGAAPGVAAGAVFASFESVALVTADGEGSAFPLPPQVVAFVARLRAGVGGVTAADDRGLWIYQRTGTSAPVITLLMRKGSLLDLNPFDELPGRTVASFTALRTQAGAAGQGNGVVLDQHNARPINLLARVRFAEGDFAMVELAAGSEAWAREVAASQELASFGIPTQSSDGQNAFTAKRTIDPESGISVENDEVVYVANDLDTPSVFPIATEGTDAPGVEGAHFIRFQTVVNNGVGSYAFGAIMGGSGITEANNSGIWLNTFTALELMAREGGPAPGVAGATFTEFESLAMPSNGRAILKARVKKANGVPRSGVWFTDDDFALRLAMREGEVIPGDRGGRVRSIRILESVRDSQAQTRSFNRRGELIYRVSFDAGRQAIVKSTIPGLPGE